MWRCGGKPRRTGHRGGSTRSGNSSRRRAQARWRIRRSPTRSRRSGRSGCNQWPTRVTEPSGGTEALLPAGLWADHALAGVCSTGPIWVALEDDYGLGAAVAAVGELPDGRLEVDAWSCPDWDSAVEELQRLADVRPLRQLLVGASLLDRVPAGTAPGPVPAGGTQTRVGLALLRDLAVGGQLVHDVTTFELDEALAVAQVREAPTGLFLIARGPTHLIRAMVWAVGAAHKPAPTPAIR